LTRYFRALALLLLLACLGVLAGIGWRTAHRAPDWVAMHYAPVPAETGCVAVAARLRAALERRGPATEDEEALLRELVTSGHCGPGARALQALEAHLGVEGG